MSIRRRILDVILFCADCIHFVILMLIVAVISLICQVFIPFFIIWMWLNEEPTEKIKSDVISMLLPYLFLDLLKISQCPPMRR